MIGVRAPLFTYVVAHWLFAHLPSFYLTFCNDCRWFFVCSPVWGKGKEEEGEEEEVRGQVVRRGGGAYLRSFFGGGGMSWEGGVGGIYFSGSRKALRASEGQDCNF